MDSLKRVVFASTNNGKLVEVRQIASEFGIEIINPADLSERSGREIPNIEEDGATYLENAKKKAEGFFAWSGIACLADDTGLEVNALGGAPGVQTARYAGDSSTPAQNMAKLLKNMEKIKDRSARFVCRLYLIDGTRIETVEEYLQGAVAEAADGQGGFGYDPIFLVEGTGSTLAALKHSGLQVETHRIKALRELFLRLR